MHISILTLFPDMFTGPFTKSIIKRAIDKKLVMIEYVNIRDFALHTYKTVDDHPYGGGAGMILRVDVVEKALRHVTCTMSHVTSRIILLDPRGIPFSQKKAFELSTLDHLVLLCGHYEGVDERVRSLVDEEISIGDYILTGGEIPAMAVVDSVVRLLPHVLKNTDATKFESFSTSLNTNPYALNPNKHYALRTLLEYPQYTRPPIWNKKKVPSVLLSGDHKKIIAWRERMAIRTTKKHRADLLRCP